MCDHGRGVHHCYSWHCWDHREGHVPHHQVVDDWDDFVFGIAIPQLSSWCHSDFHPSRCYFYHVHDRRRRRRRRRRRPCVRACLQMSIGCTTRVE